MAVDLVFETHATTTDNEVGVATGWSHGRLSERGRAQARELGRRRRGEGVAAVFAADLGRAVETVELAFAGSGIPVHLDARLRECDYGVWKGMPVTLLERQRSRRIGTPFPGGESYLQVVDRVAGFLEDLAGGWQGTRVVVVGHSATRWALDHLLARRHPRRPGHGAVRLAPGVAVHAGRRLAPGSSCLVPPSPVTAATPGSRSGRPTGRTGPAIHSQLTVGTADPLSGA